MHNLFNLNEQVIIYDVINHRMLCIKCYLYRLNVIIMIGLCIQLSNTMNVMFIKMMLTLMMYKVIIDHDD